MTSLAGLYELAIRQVLLRLVRHLPGLLRRVIRDLRGRIGIGKPLTEAAAEKYIRKAVARENSEYAREHDVSASGLPAFALD